MWMDLYKPCPNSFFHTSCIGCSVYSITFSGDSDNRYFLSVPRSVSNQCCFDNIWMVSSLSGSSILWHRPSSILTTSMLWLQSKNVHWFIIVSMWILAKTYISKYANYYNYFVPILLVKKNHAISFMAKICTHFVDALLFSKTFWQMFCSCFEGWRSFNSANLTGFIIYV